MMSYLNVGFGFSVQSFDRRMGDSDHVLKVRQDVLEVLRGVRVENKLLVAVPVHVADHRYHQRPRVVGRGHHLQLGKDRMTMVETSRHRMTMVAS